MANAVLIFAPQWSPFQPPLSLPSLKAYVEANGDHHVQCLDMNLAFYQHLFDPGFAAHPTIATGELGGLLSHLYDGPVQDLLRRLRDPAASLPEYYTAITGLESLLGLISSKVAPFEIGFNDFYLPGTEFDPDVLDARLATPPGLLGDFVDAYLDRHAVALQSADIVGLSCIGQQQLYFTLLTAQQVRSRWRKDVVIGGTVLSRIIYRGCLPRHWFGKLFDYVCMHEGERPLLELLERIEQGLGALRIPGLMTADMELVDFVPAQKLPVAEIPSPEFSGLPLGQYFSPEITLPVLSSRGCYWGKCEFCHHGMVYGAGYSSIDVAKLSADLTYLSKKYKALAFSFVDEAIPPKTFRAIGKQFPRREETGWTLNGLLKFEKYFTAEDWGNAQSVGFSAVYMGLETASERVSALLGKFTTLDDIARNLGDARQAGIWVHCFAFYGFPGETAEEARQTHDFLLERHDIIGSIGIGAFCLEHGAPIFRHPERFGVTLAGPRSGALDVYYDYMVSTGVGARQATELARETRRAAIGLPNYFLAFWCPRDLLSTALSRFSRDAMVDFSAQLQENCHLLPEETVGSQVRTFSGVNDERFAVVLANLRVFRVSEGLFQVLRDPQLQAMPMALVADQLPRRDSSVALSRA